MPAQADQAQQDERPTDSIPPIPTASSMPQVTSTDPPAIPHVPPVVPPPSGDFITVFGLEFRAMVLLFRTLNATHDALFRHMRDIRAQQDQHTTILRQIQQHLGLAPPQTDIPRPSEPIAPAEETITVDVSPQATHETATKPSSPPKNPLLDHFFILYLLSILVDIITCVDILYFGIECIT